MPFDGILLHRLMKELAALKGAKIGKIQSLGEEEVLLFVHQAEYGTRKLALCAHSNSCRIYFASTTKPMLSSPTSFVMLLRKHIGQGTIVNVEQIDFDRIVRFDIAAYNEFGDRLEYALYAEMMGKYANLVLVDARTGTIVDCLKRIPVYENSKRLLHPGALYTLPEKPQRMHPLHPGAIDPDRSLVSQIEGFSPSLSREVLYRLQAGQSYKAILSSLMTSDTLYVYDKDYHTLELLHLGQPANTWPLMKGIEEVFAAKEQKTRMAAEGGDVIRAVDREIKKLARKLPKLKDSLEQSRDYDHMRQYGDVLFAHLHEKKEPVLTLPSFEEEGRMLEIPIDMRFSIKDNANLYYKKYHKLKRAQAILEEQIEQCENQLDYFQMLKDQLAFCTLEDVAEIRQELAGKNVLRLRQGPKGKRKKKPNIVAIEIDGGWIYAGKNNLQNHYLTWDLAKRSDLWFHVKDYHGSHVILHHPSPDENHIRFAAMLAAWFSRGRYSSSVPVDYTTISQLKKVPGKDAGFVSMKSYQTIYIDPDAPLIEETLTKGFYDPCSQQK